MNYLLLDFLCSFPDIMIASAKNDKGLVLIDGHMNVALLFDSLQKLLTFLGVFEVLEVLWFFYIDVFSLDALCYLCTCFCKVCS